MFREANIAVGPMALSRTPQTALILAPLKFLDTRTWLPSPLTAFMTSGSSSLALPFNHATLLDAVTSEKGIDSC